MIKYNFSWIFLAVLFNGIDGHPLKLYKTINPDNQIINIALKKVIVNTASNSHYQKTLSDSSMPQINGEEKPSKKFSTIPSKKNFPSLMNNRQKKEQNSKWMDTIKEIVKKYSKNDRFLKLSSLNSRSIRRSARGANAHFVIHEQHNDHFQDTEPSVIKIFAPDGNRFDSWGG